MTTKNAEPVSELENEYQTNGEFAFIDELPDELARKPRSDKLLTRFVAALQDNPGRWAPWPKPAVESTTRALQSALNNDNLDDGPTAFHGAEFEASLRSDGVLYVRFIG